MKHTFLAGLKNYWINYFYGRFWSGRPDTSLNLFRYEIKKDPQVATGFFSYELQSLTSDFGGIANKSTPSMNLTIRPKPLGPYYNLLYMLRDFAIYELCKKSGYFGE